MVRDRPTSASLSCIVAVLQRLLESLELRVVSGLVDDEPVRKEEAVFRIGKALVCEYGLTSPTFSTGWALLQIGQRGREGAMF